MSQQCAEKIDFRLKDIWKFIKEAVMFSPKNEYICKRLSSFAILDNIKQIKNEQTLGLSVARHKGKDFYYRRRKDILFPLLVASVIRSNKTNRFEKNQQHCYIIDLGVLDQYKENCKNCKYCGLRTEEEIYCDTEELMNQVVVYLIGLKVVRPYKLKGSVKEYFSDEWEVFNINVLEQLIAANEIDGFDESTQLTKKIKKIFSENNNDTRGTRWSPGGGYFGYYEQFKICFKVPCEDYNLDFNFNEYVEEIEPNCCG